MGERQRDAATMMPVLWCPATVSLVALLAKWVPVVAEELLLGTLAGNGLAAFSWAMVMAAPPAPPEPPLLAGVMVAHTEYERATWLKVRRRMVAAAIVVVVVVAALLR